MIILIAAILFRGVNHFPQFSKLFLLRNQRSILIFVQVTMKDLKLVFSLTIMLLFAGCREDIITPAVIQGQINTPYANRFTEFYDFQINADELDLFYTDALPSNPNVNRLNILTTKFETGKIVVRLFDRYSRIVSVDTLLTDYSIARLTDSNGHPTKAEFEFLDFSGRFKFQMYSNN